MQTTEPEFKALPLASMVPSRTNPRTRIDPAYITSLAATIKPDRVHEPILVRPLPASRLQETFANRKPGAPLPEWEIVFGECRWLGSAEAGKHDIPSLIRRDLTDDDVLRIQLVENLKRKDLDPLEEAEGYARMVHDHGYRKEDIGTAVGKSRTTVYNTLKLLDLCQEGKEALRTGKLDATKAELIARIPDHKLQLTALKEFTATVFSGDARMGSRACKAWIIANVMLRLESASFKPADATLCPAAGPCTTCPKRTGANPELFNDVDSPDLCTDPPCYKKKEAAALERELAERRKKGMQVVEEDALDQHTALDAVVSLPGGNSPTVAELMNEYMTNAERKKATKAGVVGGQVVNMVSDDVVAELRGRVAQAAPAKPSKSSKPEAPAVAKAVSRTTAERTEAQRKLQLETQYEAAWRGQVAQAIKPLLLGGAVVVQLDAIILRKLLAVVIQGMDWDVSRAALDLLSTADQATERAAITVLPDAQLGPRICLALALEEAAELRHEPFEDSAGQLTPTTMLQHLAATCGVDVAAIQAAAQHEIRAQLAPSGKPPKPGGNPLKGSGGKQPNLTAEQAQQGIADAMQGIEAAASCGAAETPTDQPPADPLLAKAVEAITKAQKATVRLLKEELGIGTTKALELMAALEAAGKVSTAVERGARKVLVAA